MGRLPPEIDDDVGDYALRDSTPITGLILSGLLSCMAGAQSVIIVKAIRDFNAFGSGLGGWTLAGLNMLMAVGMAVFTSVQIYAEVKIWRKRKGPPPPPTDRERRQAGKRWNERLKLTAGFFNAIGASTFLAAGVVPMLVNHTAHAGTTAVVGLGVALGCHLLGQAVLSKWRSEE